MSENVTSAVTAELPRRQRVSRPGLSGKAGASETELGHLVGFGPMTRILTNMGHVPAHVLRKGDEVRTKRGAFKRIKHVDRIVLDEDFLKYHPGALPIVIRAGAFGFGVPNADMTLAPFQPLRTDQIDWNRPVSKAADCLGSPLVFRRPETMITYTVFHCGEPATVCAEGLWIDTAP